MRWQLPYVLPYLLGATAFVLPSVISRSGDDAIQNTFQVPPESSACGSDLGWTFPPSPNSTHHLIFNGVSGLLQRWPNILRRNGAPTRLVAFDFEHAYFFCRGPSYMITLQAKRDLRLVYFDGSSAAKMKDGPLDSQDVILWGRPQSDKLFPETERIEALCEWGRPFGLDGFVRMEFHFEVMLCDMVDAMEVVTFLDLIPKNRASLPTYFPGVPVPIPLPPPFEPPSGWRGSLPNGYRSFSEAYVAGSWHDHAPGETRIRLDYSGLVTFYDPSLSSLVEARYGKDRLHFRLEGISALDSERVRAELETVLTREPERVSGIDWGSIVRVITNRYAGRLEYLRSLLSPRTSIEGALEQASVARAQLLVMLAPYITTADVPKRLPASADLRWAAPIALRCATTQTSHIPLGMLTPQEARIHAAVENTLHEICRRLALVWVEFFDVEAADEAGASEAIDVAHRHIEELMAWLDWSAWVRCEPGCTVEETCYAPTWPFYEEDDPYDMSPRCVSLYVTAF
ncbi:hypothetical protein EI94DRAFT_1742479 [Lactarius quietus]|nr:hypothetical protein EI94DRAFT_1742479 [Lactarius quietus]